MWSPPVPAPPAVPVARGGVWGVLLLLPCPPGPSQPPPPAGAVGTAPGAGGSQIAKTEVASIPIWEARCPHASAFFVLVGSAGAQAPADRPRRTKPAAEPYCPTWACRPGVVCLACQYLLPPYVPSSGPPGLPPLPPGSVPPSPAGPPRTQPGQLWDQARTVGALPCASPPLASPVGPGPRMFRSLTLLLLF